MGETAWNQGVDLYQAGDNRQAAERLAMNSPIQGTAADMLKLAMIKVFRNLADSTVESENKKRLTKNQSSSESYQWALRDLNHSRKHGESVADAQKLTQNPTHEELERRLLAAFRKLPKSNQEQLIELLDNTRLSDEAMGS